MAIIIYLEKPIMSFIKFQIVYFSIVSPLLFTIFQKNSWDLGNELYNSGCQDWESTTFTDTPDLDLTSKNELQLWLQLTYEKERLLLENKMQTIKSQIEEAKEMVIKILVISV